MNITDAAILHIFISFIYFISFVSFTGCGYHLLSNHPNNSNLNTSNIANIGEYQYLINVKPILNRTPNPDLDWRVMDFIIKEITSWPGIKVKNYEEADYSLSGEIISYRSQIPYTYDKNQNPLEYKISLLMSFSLKKIESAPGDDNTHNNASGNIVQDKLIHEIPGMREEEIYRISPTNLAESKRSEWEALERALKRMIKRAMDQFISILNISYISSISSEKCPVNTY